MPPGARVLGWISIHPLPGTGARRGRNVKRPVRGDFKWDTAGELKNGSGGTDAELIEAWLGLLNDTEVVAVGSQAVGGAPMAGDSIFRLASITKPITAAAVMMLVEDGRMALANGVHRHPSPWENGGLIGTAGDWLAFARMLLAGGTTADGRQLLSPDSVQLMINNHITYDQHMIDNLFLEGQCWGFGGSVDIATIDPWNVPGRYGWVGGTGTSAHITPSTGTVTILLTQVAADSPNRA
jgi:CubicO group peptidase (beta-lactamase class C family)